MAIEQRGIKVGSSRLAYGTPARDARMGVPRQTNWVGLAESLGVAVGGVKEDLEEEAKREAISKVHEINVKTAGKSPEERQKAIEDAKAGLGAGRGFFSKLLIDEDKEVKAFDEASWSMRAVDTKREVELMESRMRLEGKSHMEIQEAVTALYNKNLEASESVSDSAKASYLKGINDHAHSMLKSMSLKEQKRVYDIKKKQVDDELDKLVYDAIGASGGSTPSDMASVSTMADFEKADNITNANIVGITAEVSKRAQDVYDRATKDFLLDKQEARRSVADLYMKASSLYHNPELYDSLMSAPAKGGKSYKEAYPEEYLKNMQVLKSARVKYLADLQEKTKVTQRANTDESFYSLYENSKGFILDYDSNPSVESLKALTDHRDSFNSKYEEMKSSGAFRYDKSAQKTWIDHKNYLDTHLKTKAYDRDTDAKGRELLDEGKMTKKEFILNGHRYSPELRVDARLFIERYEASSNAETNELAKANIQHQYSVAKQSYTEAMNKVNNLDMVYLTDSQQKEVSELQQDLKLYGDTIYKQELHVEREKVVNDPNHRFNGSDVKLRVAERIQKEYVKPILDYYNTTSQANKDNARSRAEGATVSAPEGDTASAPDAETEQADSILKSINNEGRAKLVGDVGSKLKSKVVAEGFDKILTAGGAETPEQKQDAVIAMLKMMDFKSQDELAYFLSTERGREITTSSEQADEIIKEVMGKRTTTGSEAWRIITDNSVYVKDAIIDHYSAENRKKVKGTTRTSNRKK